MCTPQLAEALRRVVAAAEAGGASAADLRVVGEFLEGGGVFPSAALRGAGLPLRGDAHAAAAPARLSGDGDESGGDRATATRLGAEQRASDAPTLYQYATAGCYPSPDQPPEPPVSCSAGGPVQAALSAAGRVYCESISEGISSWDGCLGVGDSDDRDGFVASRLPWRAAAVSCGDDVSVALSRGGGAVCSWGAASAALGRFGDGSLPAEVQGLPAGDPVVLLQAGAESVIAVTQSDKAYGWGDNTHGQLALPLAVGGPPVPQRIEALSGLGLRRLACGGSFLSGNFAVAETGAGELLIWGELPVHAGVPRRQRAPPQPQPQPLQPRAGCVAFPLRSLAAGRRSAVGVADGAGQLWCLWAGQGALATAGLPPAERVVRAAVCSEIRRRDQNAVVVALTAEGRLWDCRAADPCRSITAAHQLPLWLLPCEANGLRFPLIADVCGGKARLRLLARIAVRVGLPADPVRAVLTGHMVRGEYVTGPAHDPFSWPDRPRAEQQ